MILINGPWRHIVYEFESPRFRVRSVILPRYFTLQEGGREGRVIDRAASRPRDFARVFNKALPPHAVILYTTTNI